jgi:hypothetical protein
MIGSFAQTLERQILEGTLSQGRRSRYDDDDISRVKHDIVFREPLYMGGLDCAIAIALFCHNQEQLPQK